MDWLATILTSNNLIQISVILVAIILLLSFLSKKGIFSFNAYGLKVGTADKEREIMRRQLEYTANAIQEFLEFIPKCENYNAYRAKYAAEKVFDEVVTWISFNHIRTDDFYVSCKQTIVWNILQGIGQNDIYKTDTFKKSCNEITERIIKQLVEIREYYSK